jgi:hypothetical protein
MTRRAVLVAVTALLGALAPSAGAADAPPGTLEETSYGGDRPVVSDHGDTGTFLQSDGGGEIIRWHTDDEIGISVSRDLPIAPDLIASDPTTGDVVFTQDDRLRRIADGRVTTLLEGLEDVRGLDVGPDGSIHLGLGTRIDRIDPIGVRTTVVDEIVRLRTLSVAPDGRLWWAADFQIHRLTGTIDELLTHHEPCFLPQNPCGDAGQASAAKIATVTVMEHGPDGTLYFGDDRGRVRAVRPDLRMEAVAGRWEMCHYAGNPCGHGELGPLARLDPVVGLAVVGDDLYIADRGQAPYGGRVTIVRDVATMPVVEPQGYRMIASDGGVFTFGWSTFLGSTGALRLESPIVAGVSNGGSGYWFVAGDGGVFTFNTPFFGSAVGRTTSPIVDMAKTTSGLGYWLLERNGNVHAFGDAPSVQAPPDAGPYAALLRRDDGSMERVPQRPADLPRLNHPILHARATHGAGGAWLVAADGGVFTRGDAEFFGSTGNLRLNQPVVDLVPTPSGKGYWLIARDGGVFTFGDARFMGSMGAVRLNQPVVAGISGPDAS